MAALDATAQMTARQRFLAACAVQEVDRPPVWIMRQAGRYLPEYRELRQQYDFRELVRTPKLAAEVTFQPLRRFGLDAAIIFSDILVIPEAMGIGYSFRDQGGIALDKRIESAADVDALSTDDITAKLAYVTDALREVRQGMGAETALLGFAGSPWTLATYLLEGGSSTHFKRIKALQSEQPALLDRLLEKLASAIAPYLAAQLKAGADAVQIFDSWASACPGHAYRVHSLRWIGEIIQQLPRLKPVILYAKGAAHHLEGLCDSGAGVLGFDQSVDLAAMAGQMLPGLAVQGNLDPVLLDGPPEVVARETNALLTRMATRRGFICNLGHGILPSARPESVAALVETVHRFTATG